MPRQVRTVLWVCTAAVLGYAVLLGFGVRAADVNDLLFQGIEQHDAGNLDQAIASFEQALALDPENELALTQLGYLYTKKEQVQKAAGMFEKALAVNGSNVEARVGLGVLYLEQGDLERAFNTYETLIRVAPDNPDGYYYLGTIYNFRRNRIKAIEYLKKSSDLNSVRDDLHYRLAQAFDVAGMISNAQLEYQRTLDLNPRHTRAYNALGWIYYNQGNVEEALAAWKKSLSVSPDDQDTVLNLAKAYNDMAYQAMKRGRTEEAVGYWRETLSVHPGNKAATYYLSKYKR